MPRSTMLARSGRAILAGLALGACLTMAACPKKEPPPPPPPPEEPPPPPEPVSLQALAQDMQVDPRITFADGMEVEQDEEDLGRAVIKFADAIAKGDAEAARSMMSAKDQSLLSELENSGEWSEQTGKLESIRIVFLDGGLMLDVNRMMSAAATSLVDPALMDSALSQFGESLTPELREEIQRTAELLREGGNDAMRSTLESIIERLRSNGASPEQIAGFETALAAFESQAEGGTPALPSGSDTGVLIALQDPSGAYLTGWRATLVGDEWTFAGAPSIPDSRPRAQSFDGIGAAGFNVGGRAPAPRPDKPDEGAPDENIPEGEGGGGGSDPGRDPSRRTTPVGPVTIPRPN